MLQNCQWCDNCFCWFIKTAGVFMQYKIMMCFPLKSTHSLTMPHMPWNLAKQTWHLAENNKKRELWVNIHPCFLNILYSLWFLFQCCVFNRASPGVLDSEQVQTKGGFISRCIILSQQPSNGLSFNLNGITYYLKLMVAIMAVWAAKLFTDSHQLSRGCIVMVTWT